MCHVTIQGKNIFNRWNSKDKADLSRTARKKTDMAGAQGGEGQAGKVDGESECGWG